MAAIKLKKLADKVRRGQRGRVEAGFSAGGRVYGYKVVLALDADGEVTRGLREIDPTEAASRPQPATVCNCAEWARSVSHARAALPQHHATLFSCLAVASGAQHRLFRDTRIINSLRVADRKAPERDGKSHHDQTL